MTSGLEMEWDYYGIKRRDGQKKKIGKMNKKKREKVKKSKMPRLTLLSCKGIKKLI